MHFTKQQRFKMCFDYRRSALSFRSALSVDDSVRELKKCSGTQFDPAVVKTFTDDVDKHRISYHAQHS
jgi:response regulator RpfG family c-di-GMP phosphodiesterase